VYDQNPWLVLENTKETKKNSSIDFQGKIQIEIQHSASAVKSFHVSNNM